MPNKIVPNEAWLKRSAIALISTGGLGLAAAPTFAVMALLTWLRGGDMPDMFCAAVHGSSLLGGMVPMYLLMSAFHLTPWLRLMASRRSRAHSRRSGIRQIARLQAFP